MRLHEFQIGKGKYGIRASFDYNEDIELEITNDEIAVGINCSYRDCTTCCINVKDMKEILKKYEDRNKKDKKQEEEIDLLNKQLLIQTHALIEAEEKVKVLLGGGILSKINKWFRSK